MECHKLEGGCIGLPASLALADAEFSSGAILTSRAFPARRAGASYDSRGIGNKERVMWTSTVENNIREILRCVYYRPNRHHHLGRPFLTAYQLEIEYDRRFPELRRQLGLTIGGSGSGEHQSLPQWLARNLSQRIRNGDIEDIEGGFLSDLHRADISFNGPGGPVRSSVGDISIFRLIESD